GYSVLVTCGVVVLTTVGQLFTSIMAAYAFARLKFWGRDTLFWIYLSTMMIPAAVTLIPLFLLMSQLGLKNTFWGIVLPFALISPYAIFLLRQFFLGFSQDVIDAAKLDGASQWRVLWGMLVPNAKPIIVTLAIITFVSHWNNFLWPLMIASGKQTRTMTVAIAQLQSAHDGQWWLVMAATTVSLIPLVIVLSVFHKQLLSSITISRVGS
ncbi:MAG: carbohydrate ABC transporter permease, partial [Canibacter sp.]